MKDYLTYQGNTLSMRSRDASCEAFDGVGHGRRSLDEHDEEPQSHLVHLYESLAEEIAQKIVQRYQSLLANFLERMRKIGRDLVQV